MNRIKYYIRLGVTAACTRRMKESEKGICQRYIKGATKDCFLFGGWFSSKNLAEAVIYFCADIIGMVRTNTKGF